MKILSKNEILDITVLYFQTKDILVPEWGEDVGVKIKKFNAGDVVHIQETVVDNKPTLNYYCSLISYSIVDEKGNNIFSNSEVAKWNAPEFNRLLIEVMDFNGMSPEKVAEARKELKN
jgi:hypothetical protein